MKRAWFGLTAEPGALHVRRKIPMLHEYAAIDPMALLVPSRIYISMTEKLHPHAPKAGITPLEHWKK